MKLHDIGVKTSVNYVLIQIYFVYCRRYLNVCVKSSSHTANLGLVRCRGTVTAKMTAEMVKVSILFVFFLNKFLFF